MTFWLGTVADSEHPLQVMQDLVSHHHSGHGHSYEICGPKVYALSLNTYGNGAEFVIIEDNKLKIKRDDDN